MTKILGALCFQHDNKEEPFVYIPMQGPQAELVMASKLPPEVLTPLVELADTNNGTVYAAIVDWQGKRPS